MHADVLASHPDVDELVVNDVDQTRGAEVAQKTGGTHAASVEGLFAADLDGVVIAAASTAHGELLTAAIDAGVTVFCEKPVAVDIEGMRSVLTRAAAANIPVQVGFQRRFDPGYVAAHEAIASGKLGEVRRVHMVSADPSPSNEKFTMESGGIYRDLHIHDFDILRFVTGREVVVVYATGANRGAEYFARANDVDESVILLTLDDGTLVTAQGSRYNGNGYDIRMEVAGTEKTYIVGLSERTPVKSAEPGVTFPNGEPWVLFWDRFRSSYGAELNAFVDLVAGRRENPCSVDDALQALYIAEAAERSRRERRPVQIAEFTADEVAVR